MDRTVRSRAIALARPLPALESLAPWLVAAAMGLLLFVLTR